MVVPLNKPVVCPVVIGRTTELTAIHQLIENAKSGQGQVALLSGEAGVGKSRLVKEAKTYATQSMCILQGICFESDQSYPYAPLLDLLRTFFNTRAPEDFLLHADTMPHELIKLLPELANGQLDVRMMSGDDPQQEKRRLFAVLAKFFIHQATQKPVLLIVEDLHWCDETSLEFLLYLVRRCTSQPMLMIFTYRNDEVHANLRHWLAQLERERLAQELALVKLSRNDVAAMLNAIFNKQYPIHRDFLDYLCILTEGNPFFIEEILKSLIASGELVFTNGKWVGRPLHELHIPRNIQDAVQQRIEGLSAVAKQILTLASVTGVRFDFALLQQLTHDDEQQILAVMKVLIAAQLVIEESAEQFAFRHALTRQAIYTQLLVRERRALHLKIAETIESMHTATLEPYLEDLAYHYYKAEVWEKAIQYGQLAGYKAQALYSPRAAIEHYSQALHAAQQMALLPSTTLYRRRGQAYETLGNFEQARSDYKQALDIARRTHDGAAEWQSVIDLGFLWAERDYEQAGTFYHQASELARTLDEPKLEAHSLNRMGNWHLNIEQPLEALRYHRKALTIFQELHDQQAIALFRDLDDRHGLTSSLATLTLRGPTFQTDIMVSASTNVAEVIQDTEKALKIAREIEQRQWQAAAHTVLGGVYSGLLANQQAREHFEQALTLAREIGSLFWTRIATGYLASTTMIMSTMQTKSLKTPEEIRTLPKTTVEVIDFGELSLMKLTFQPGWRWSEHVKPTAGTESCEVPHFNYGISGRLHVRMDDGTESEIGPGHDAWVVGDEPYVGLDFQGGHLYAK